MIFLHSLLNQKLIDSTLQKHPSFENYIKQLNKNTKLEEIKDLTSRLKMIFVSDSDIESEKRIDVNRQNIPTSQTSHVFLIHAGKDNKNTLLYIYDYEQNNK